MMGDPSQDAETLAEEVMSHADSEGISLMAAMDDLGYPRYSGCESQVWRRGSDGVERSS